MHVIIAIILDSAAFWNILPPPAFHIVQYDVDWRVGGDNISHSCLKIISLCATWTPDFL